MKEYKGKPPVQTFEERKEMLKACKYVDCVVKNHFGKDSKPMIIITGCDVIVNGSDWTRETLIKQMGLTEEFLNYNGLRIILCPLPREFSTTELKERVHENRRVSVQ